MSSLRAVHQGDKKGKKAFIHQLSTSSVKGGPKGAKGPKISGLHLHECRTGSHLSTQSCQRSPAQEVRGMKRSLKQSALRLH